MPPLTIHVTEQDIEDAYDLGERENSVLIADRCPVALAATREIGTPIRVDTDEKASQPPTRLRLHLKRRGFDHSKDVWLPEEVVRRVNIWDDEGLMSPFDFTVEIP